MPFFGNFFVCCVRDSHKDLNEETFTDVSAPKHFKASDKSVNETVEIDPTNNYMKKRKGEYLKGDALETLDDGCWGNKNKSVIVEKTDVAKAASSGCLGYVNSLITNDSKVNTKEGGPTKIRRCIPRKQKKKNSRSTKWNDEYGIKGDNITVNSNSYVIQAFGAQPIKQQEAQPSANTNVMDSPATLFSASPLYFRGGSADCPSTSNNDCKTREQTMTNNPLKDLSTNKITEVFSPSFLPPIAGPKNEIKTSCVYVYSPSPSATVIPVVKEINDRVETPMALGLPESDVIVVDVLDELMSNNSTNEPSGDSLYRPTNNPRSGYLCVKLIRNDFVDYENDEYIGDFSQIEQRSAKSDCGSEWSRTVEMFSKNRLLHRLGKRKSNFNSVLEITSGSYAESSDDDLLSLGTERADSTSSWISSTASRDSGYQKQTNRKTLNAWKFFPRRAFSSASQWTVCGSSVCRRVVSNLEHIGSRVADIRVV